MPSPVTPPRPAYVPPSDSEDDEAEDEAGEEGAADGASARPTRDPPREVCVLSSFLAPLPGAASAAAAPRPPLGARAAFGAGAGLTAAATPPPASRLERACALLRTALAVEPNVTTGAYLGICLAWSGGARPSVDAQRQLQNCVELLRPAGAPPSFNHAVLANSSVRLLLEERRFDDPNLVAQLVTVGKVLGVLNIEKHVQVLDAHNEVDAIKEVYTGIVPDFDQTQFFRQKGWLS